MRRISNSEVGTWLNCRQRYYLAFVKQLQKKQQGEPIAKGTLGHEVLSVYYQRIKDGVGHEQAKHDALDHLMTYLAVGNSEYALNVITEVRRILELYWAYYAERDLMNWDIIHVERDYDLELNEHFTMPMRLDMLVFDKSDKRHKLIDHKFYYNMPDWDKLALNVQFPKYVAALRSNDVPVDECVLNVLRTRSLKNPALPDLFKRYPVVATNAKIKTAVRNHILASQEIAEYRSLPEAMQKERALPLMNDFVCGNCDYKSICITEFDGGDADYLIQQDYKQNTYGYTQPENIGDLL
jgi:hypothetical protein